MNDTNNSCQGIYDEPMELSATARGVIRAMLNPNPRERITIAELRKHPWITEGYDDPPPSMLSVRPAVFEVRDDILAQLMTLGFKGEEAIRKQILDNECCQVVAMYHLMLDRKVADELAELKKSMLGAATASAATTSAKPPAKIVPRLVGSILQ